MPQDRQVPFPIEEPNGDGCVWLRDAAGHRYFNLRKEAEVTEMVSQGPAQRAADEHGL